MAFDRGFLPSVNKLGAGESKRVWEAVEKYQKTPSAPGLNLEKLEGRAGRRRLWTIRASQELRVLLAREGPTSVLLRAGHHDAVYNLASRTAFTAPVAGTPGLIAIRPDTIDLDGAVLKRAPLSTASRAGREPSILEHWRDRELADAGFDQEAVERLRRATADTLLDVWPDIPEAVFDQVIECSELTPDQWRSRLLFADEESDHKRFRDAIVERGALAGLSSLLSAEEFRRLRAAPIEDWMIFLHPDQRALAERSFKGTARVRGAAGTGKTVVAIHRAAALARRLPVHAAPRPSVLFSTFIKSLPPVFENLYGRLPSAAPGAVEFISIDKLAHRICRDAGAPPKLNPEAAEEAFKEAFATVVESGTPLHRANVSRAYLKEEVVFICKGRGVDSPAAYQALERTGRRTRFTAPMREQAWALHEEWSRRLAEAEIEDFSDVIRRARDLAQRRPEPLYRAAIVDESQDLTLVGLQFVRALVHPGADEDQPDELFLVGDGAQKIYPGGFTLAQAGVDVRGNSAVLRVNYRNTRQIIDAAMACAGSEPVNDLGDAFKRGDAATDTERGGIRPVLVRLADFDAQIAWVARQVRSLRQRTAALGCGDIGVFAAYNQVVKQAISGLEAEGFRCRPLAKFDGRPNDDIKVGTFDRAKGLEFKVVFLLEMSAFPRPFQSGDEEEERRALDISKLFVAMTRARDGLFLLCRNKPSEVVESALDHFEEIESS